MRVSILHLALCLLALSAQAQVREVAPTGKLRITSTPEGCTVLLDTQFVGTTPVLLDSVRTGIHVIAVAKQGFCTATDSFQVTGGQLQERAVTLDPECILTVDSDPADAAVYVDRVFRGRTPARIGQLHDGDHPVMVLLRDHERWNDTVHLTPTSPARLKAELRNRPSLISVVVPDSTTEIIINNASTGFGSLQDFTIASGVMSLKLWQRSTNEVVQGEYYIPPATSQTFRADFNKPSHTAFWLSLLCPGLGEFMDGSRIKGLAIAAGFFATVANANARWNDYSSKNAELTAVVEKYRQSNWPPDIVALRNPVRSAYDDARASARARDVSIGIVVAWYVGSALDAWFFHDKVSEIVTIDSKDPTALSSRAILFSPAITMRIPL